MTCQHCDRAMERVPPGERPLWNALWLCEPCKVAVVIPFAYAENITMTVGFSGDDA